MVILVSPNYPSITMSKSSNFFGQPIYGQLIKSLDREKIVEMSRRHGGEKYVKSFDGYTHLPTMLYAVIQRFDSLREIETSMTAEVRKLHHVGIDTVPKRSTLSDANARRPEKFFEEVYHDLYEANKAILSSDSRRNGTEEWIKRLRIIDSTTVSLFSNAIFKGVGRHPKTGRKKGGIKVHAVIHANEGVPCDVQFIIGAARRVFDSGSVNFSFIFNGCIMLAVLLIAIWKRHSFVVEADANSYEDQPSTLKAKAPESARQPATGSK